jgi:hypothetical protein
MAPVVVELGAQSGLLVPLIAVHMFVFYFGLMADVTPPVGLASFAAAAIARTDPIRTGITAFYYSMRTAILPFLFIFNTQLLLIGITDWFHLLLTIASAITAMLVFAAATQGYFLVKSRWHETVALFLVTFTLFRPGFWWDMVYPPFEHTPPSELMKIIEEKPANASLRLWVEGETLEGQEFSKGVLVPLGAKAPARERLKGAGFSLMTLGDEVSIGPVAFGSVAAKLGLEAGFKVTGVELPVERPAKEWMFIPALLLLALVIVLQRSRLRRQPAAAGTAA